MYREGVCAVFSEREASSFGTSDFVVTRGYVQIRVVGFPAPRATVAIQASQKVLAQLLTLTMHGH